MTEAIVSTHGNDGTGTINVEEDFPQQTLIPALDKRVVAAEQELALEFTGIVDPGNWTMMEAIQTYRKQCYSAFVAVSLIISGADPQLLCNITKSPDLQLSLSNKGLDGQQIADLLCFWARFGYSFSISIFQVLNTLATAATSFTYAIEYGLNSTQDITRLCGSLNLGDPMYQKLHVDSGGINSALCSGTATSATTSSGTITSITSQTVSVSSGQVVWSSWGVNGTFVSTGSAGAISWSNGIGTGAATATLGGGSWSAGNESMSATGTAVSGSWAISNGSALATATETTGSDSAGNVSAPTTGTGASEPWVVNGTASATGTGVPISWSASWNVNGSIGVTSDLMPTGHDLTTTAAGIGASGSWSSGWGFNATGVGSAGGPTGTAVQPVTTVSNNGTVVVIGSGSSDSLSLTTFTDFNGSIIVSVSAAVSISASSVSAGDSWGIGNPPGPTPTATSEAGGLSTMPGPVQPTGNGINITAPSPTLSWTTFTDTNGSVIVAGTDATTVASSFFWTISNATGDGGMSGSMWSSGASADIVSYTGLAWSSWIVSSTPTVAVITGTAGPIPYGTSTMTAMITGSGQAATFTIVVQVTKTIVIVATAVGQTWTVFGAGAGAGTISGVGTAGTWALEPISGIINGSSPSPTGPVISDAWGNTTKATGGLPGTASSAPTTPLVPGGVPGGWNITATGEINVTSTMVNTATTSVPGKASALVNTTEISTGLANTTTTIIDASVRTNASFGTGAVTTNSANVTFSFLTSDAGNNITASTVTGKPKLSYPDWTTSTSVETST